MKFQVSANLRSNIDVELFILLNVSDFTYIVLQDLKSQEENGMELKKEEKVHVIHKDSDYWWFVMKDISGVSGWVPSFYLIDEQSYNEQKIIEEKISHLPVSFGKLIFM